MKKLSTKKINILNSCINNKYKYDDFSFYEKYGEIFDDIFDFEFNKSDSNAVIKQKAKYYDEEVIKENFKNFLNNKVRFEYTINEDNKIVIADCVSIINDEVCGFEIKTEYDTLKRLPRQLEMYQKYFQKVYVLTYLENIEKVKKIINDNIGIFVYKIENNNIIFEKIKEAKINNIDYNLVKQRTTCRSFKKFLKSREFTYAEKMKVIDNNIIMGAYKKEFI